MLSTFNVPIGHLYVFLCGLPIYVFYPFFTELSFFIVLQEFFVYSG